MVEDYRTKLPPDQLAIMDQEVKNVDPLTARGNRWLAAGQGIAQANSSFAAASAGMKPAWRDDNGKFFAERSDVTKGILGKWAESTGPTANPGQEMIDIAGIIPMIHQTVQANTEQWKALQLFMSYVGDPTGKLQEDMDNLQRANGIAMNDLDNRYNGLHLKIKANIDPLEPYQGLTEGEPPPAQEPGPGPSPTSASPGGPGGSPGGAPGGAPPGGAPGGEPPGGAPGGAPPGGAPGGAPPGGAPGGAPPGGAPGGAPPGGAPGGEPPGGMPGGMPNVPDPSLSGGLGGAPNLPNIPPPTTPNLPNLPNSSLPTPNLSGGLPPGGLGGIGGGGGGGGIPKIGGGGVGGIGGPNGTQAQTAGLRNPGVLPAGLAPSAPGLGGAGGAAPGTGMGAGGMPMMPPMGGMGAGAGGGGGQPGSGAAQRPMATKGRRRDDGRTPGMPSMLGGRAAGRAEPPAQQQASQASDVPSQQQVIDEDLWQVEDRQQVRRLGH